MRFYKMNYIKQSIWAFAAIALVACSSDDDKDTTESLTPVENTSTSFSATIETGNSGSSKATRTSLVTDADVPYPVWSSGDQLHIYNATTPANALFGLKSEDYVGQRQGVFDGTITKNAGDKFFALYCSTLTGTGAPTLTASNGSATISATIPATQSTTPGFHPDLHFMTACTTGSTFKLKNAMSLIRVNIADNNYDNFKICRIRFKANKTSEKIAGNFTATIGDDGTLSDYSVTNGSNEIVIDGGVNGLSTGTYYIAILPCAFSEGFTLAFEEYRSQDTHTEVFDRIRETAFNVDASEIINLGTYTAKACAKEAYVDLGITREIDGVTKKVLWCIENVYDEAGEAITGTNRTTTETDPNSSFYAWGENYVKSNQYKVQACQNYSWYYSYSLGQGSSSAQQAEEAAHFEKRSYKYGIGNGNWWDAVNSTLRWTFHPNYKGVLIKYNSEEYYTSSITDWGGGNADGKTELELMDDAAYQKSLKFQKNIVRIASEKDFVALWAAVNDKTLKFIKLPSSYGFQHQDTKCYITLPIAGYRYQDSASDDPVKDTDVACYWTRERTTSKDNLSYQARAVRIRDSGVFYGDEPRCAGRMLRGVIYR